jgi:hypothetical protein
MFTGAKRSGRRVASEFAFSGGLKKSRVQYTFDAGALNQITVVITYHYNWYFTYGVVNTNNNAAI